MFFPAEYEEPMELADKNYPFIFTTGKSICHMHTGSYTQQSKVLSSLAPKDILEINPVDAEKFDLKDGDMARIISRRGEIKLPVKILDWVAPGTVFTTFHSVDVPINVLTNDVLDPIAKVPELKICAVKLEKV